MPSAPQAPEMDQAELEGELQNEIAGLCIDAWQAERLSPYEMTDIFLEWLVKTGRTRTPVSVDEHGQTEENYAELGHSFFEEYNRHGVHEHPAMAGYICAESPVEIIWHLLNAWDEKEPARPEPSTTSSPATGDVT